MLDTPDKEGVSMRHRLIQVYDSTGKLPRHLADEPHPIDVAKYLLDYFWELCAGRGMMGLGMAGACHAPLTYPDIESWRNLKKIDLSPWEVAVIKALDAVYLKEINSRLLPKKG